MRIHEAWAALEASDLHPVLRRRHGEPWRQYHVWEHPLAMVRHIAAAEDDGVVISDPEACAAFCGWHDSIYDAQAVHGRNEELSAQLCEAEAGSVFPWTSVARASAATRCTIRHEAVDAAICPDIALKLDVDLSILGADEDAFDFYDEGIRREYAHVPADAYAAGRAAVLGRFLERPRLYLTDWGHARWEGRARTNLERTIARLKSTTT